METTGFWMTTRFILEKQTAGTPLLKHDKCTSNLIKTMGGSISIFMLSRVNLRLQGDL